MYRTGKNYACANEWKDFTLCLKVSAAAKRRNHEKAQVLEILLDARAV